ncbi:MAG TPA: M20/M25/M40 family metallo-hydrolase [Thermomicrobiales bacterium]|nr:M20/M25/M40 family metallo-hydrolase [Thermomicrobiales bacterium]
MPNDLMGRIDWNSVRDEVTQHLQTLIRFETVNPPGNEALVAGYLKEMVEKAGLSATIVEKTSGRGNFVTRVKSTGNGRPLLLMAHADVVSVEADKWTHPPFEAGIHDGMIWGRGAVDTKNLVASELMVMLLLARNGLTLDRDVIMCTFADEEAGGRDGADFMWQEHRELIDAEVAINEGGGQAVDVMGKRFYMCQTGEKGGARMTLVASAPPGHASVPRDDTAMLRMGRALVKLSQHQFPTIITASVERMLLAMGESIGGDATELVNDILSDPSWENLSKLPLGEVERLSLRATTRNTAVPTIIHGGHRINVIPGEITCDVDGRVLPGQNPADFVQQVRDLIGDDVEVRAHGNGSSGIEADPDSALFETIREVMGEIDPGSEVAPFLVSGGTDAKSIPGIKVYGFNPGRFSDVEMNGAHNHDERVSIDNLEFATRALFDITTRYSAAR